MEGLKTKISSVWEHFNQEIPRPLLYSSNGVVQHDLSSNMANSLRESEWQLNEKGEDLYEKLRSVGGMMIQTHDSITKSCLSLWLFKTSGRIGSIIHFLKHFCSIDWQSKYLTSWYQFLVNESQFVFDDDIHLWWILNGQVSYI